MLRKTSILLHLWRVYYDKDYKKTKKEKESKINFFMEFTKIRKHFFRDFNKKLALVKDVRHTSYITYEL